MPSSSFLLLQHLRSRATAAAAAGRHLPAVLSPARAMGGGPRTFPGGLSKWQYKRMHEKLAREKQRGLLRHEKQLYLARLRSEIRAKLLPSASSSAAAAGTAPAMSSRDHIKALADRFAKAGAEDLWNDDDGPLRSPRHGLAGGQSGRKELRLGRLGSLRFVGDWNGGKERPLEKSSSEGLVGDRDTKKEQPLAQLGPGRLVRDWNGRRERPLAAFNPKREHSVVPHWPHRNSDAVLLPLAASRLVGDGNARKDLPSVVFDQKRLYSVANRVGRVARRWRPDSSDEDEESGSELGDAAVVERDLRFGRLGSMSEGELEEEDTEGKGIPRKKMRSSAALRKCGTKKERRVLKSFEEESRDLAGRIRELREEIRSREPLRSERLRYESREESLLTKKRFDECGISPLTVKALTDAGYTQTTVVQEAALPICLEGKDVLVKAKTGTGKSAAFLS